MARDPLKGLVDPKMYTHVSTDKDKTVLKHKMGHTVTIAHNVLSPQMQTQLKALAPASQEQSPVKEAKGGEICMDEGGKVPAPATDTSTDNSKNKQVSQGASQSGGIPSDSPIKTGNWGGVWAEGGEVCNICGNGECKCQPNNPKLAESNKTPPARKMYAEAGEVKKDSAPDTKNWGEAVGHALSTMFSRKTDQPNGIVPTPATPQQVQDNAENTPDTSAMGVAQAPQTPPTDPNFNSVNGQTAQQAPQPAQAQPDLAPQTQGQPEQPAPAQQPQTQKPDTTLARPDNMPQPQHAQDVYEALNNEAANVLHDYQNGHISPETYGDLYAKKGTLGKIGTLFGLLVSGAGSGLTHQPNAVLEMMDKEIARDLDAQKTSKAGQVNFLNTASNMLKAKSDMALQGLQGKEAQARTGEINANANLLKTNNAMTLMRMGVLQHLTGTVDKLPPGQQKTTAQNALNGVSNAVAQKTQQENAQTAQAISNNSEAAYNQRTQDWRNAQAFGIEGAGDQVQYRESHLIPGVGTTTKPVNEAGADRVLKINNFQNLLQEANQMQSAQKLGPITPAQKARAIQLKNDLISSYNDVKGLNRFTSNEEKLYDKVVPDLTSNLGALDGAQKASLDRLTKSVQQKKDLEYNQLGIQPFQGNGQSPAQQSQSQPDMKSKSGRPVEMRNGKMYYK